MEHNKRTHNGQLYSLLFAIFLFYRLYFWGEISANYHHSLLNALGDVAISIWVGRVLFFLKENRNLSINKFYATGVVIVLASIVALYLYHYCIYLLFGQLAAGFDSMFKAICFQLLDSVAIVVIGSFSIIIDLMKVEKNVYRLALNHLERENLQTELKYLKAQLDPHFVFNSLNTIFYQLKDTESEVKNSVTEFSEILRYHMKSNLQAKITLQEEVKYIKSYIAFNRKRYADFIDIQTSFDIGETDVKIQPLLFLPLVENAFKFSSDDAETVGKVDISLDVDASQIVFEVRNSFNPLGLKNLQGQGIGLDNVKKKVGASIQQTTHTH